MTPGDPDPFREARAYHFSVYLMVGMPYLLLGTVGLLIYRAVRHKDRADQAIAGLLQAGEEVHNPCPGPSRGDPS